MYCRYNGPLRPNWPRLLPITTANPARARQPQLTFTRLPPQLLEPLPLYMSLLQDTNKLPSHLPPHRHRLLITRGPFWPRLQPTPLTPCLHICSRPLLLPQQPHFSPGTPKLLPLPTAMHL